MRLRLLSRPKIAWLLFFLFLAIFVFCFFLIDKRQLIRRISSDFTYLSGSLGLHLSDIIIENNDVVSYSDVVGVVGSQVDIPMIKINAKDIKLDLENNIEWIKSASVRKEYPNKIVIEIKEYSPVAIFFNGKSSVLIDISGREIIALEKCKKNGLERKFSRLIKIEGEGAKENISNLLSIIRVNQLIFQDIVAAKRVGGRRWNIIFHNELEVMLPESEEGESWKHVIEALRRDKSIPLKFKKIDCRVRGRIYFVS